MRQMRGKKGKRRPMMPPGMGGPCGAYGWILKSILQVAIHPMNIFIGEHK